MHMVPSLIQRRDVRFRFLLQELVRRRVVPAEVWKNIAASLDDISNWVIVIRAHPRKRAPKLLFLSARFQGTAKMRDFQARLFELGQTAPRAVPVVIKQALARMQASFEHLAEVTNTAPQWKAVDDMMSEVIFQIRSLIRGLSPGRIKEHDRHVKGAMRVPPRSVRAKSAVASSNSGKERMPSRKPPARDRPRSEPGNEKPVSEYRLNARYPDPKYGIGYVTAVRGDTIEVVFSHNLKRTYPSRLSQVKKETKLVDAAAAAKRTSRSKKTVSSKRPGPSKPTVTEKVSSRKISKPSAKKKTA